MFLSIKEKGCEMLTASKLNLDSWLKIYCVCIECTQKIKRVNIKKQHSAIYLFIIHQAHYSLSACAVYLKYTFILCYALLRFGMPDLKLYENL